MKLSLVRKIDYWVGIPVCFILTLFDYLLARIFGKRKRPVPPKKILFIELSEMGSAILCYPTMEWIRREHPDSELFFMIFEKNRASVDMLGIMPGANVLTINDGSFFSFLFDLIRVLIKIRREGIDTVFDLELFARVTAIITYLSGAGRRVGFYRYCMEGLYRGDLLTHKIQYNYQQHIAKSFLSFVKALSSERQDFPTMDKAVFNGELDICKIESSKDDIKNIRKKIKDLNPEAEEGQSLVILSPSAGELSIRAWPAANYVELGKKILKNFNAAIVITGAWSDEETTGQVYKGINNKRCIDLTGETSFEELIALYNTAGILVTSDSGPAHFASMTSVKSFVFFGPETPKIYSPLGCNVHVLYSGFPCSPCLSAFNHRKTTCNDNQCLQAISVSHVYNSIKKELQ